MSRAFLLLAALAMLAGDTAHAALLNWLNAAGGPAAVAANWNPAQVPAEVDALRFNVAGAYTVTFGALVDSVASHGYWSGDVTLDFASPHGLSGLFAVAPNAGQVATVRHTAGTLRLGSLATIGAGVGATGVLRVNGGTTNLFQNTAGSPFMNIGPDGAGGGSGELVVLGGGAVELAGGLNIGRASGSTGTLRVRGLGGGRRSHCFADATSRDVTMGGGGSLGVLEVLDGGLFRSGRDFIVSEGASDASTITIGGENTIDSSEVRVGDDLRVGVNATSGQAGGTATITLDSLGVLVVNDSTVVGDADGSSGVITLHANSRMITKHLILQQPSGGTIDLQGGRLQIAGGTLATATGRLTIPGGSNLFSQRPVLEMLSGATATLSGTTVNPPLVVGSTGGVELQVNGGSSLTANGGSVVIGQNPGSNGTLHVGSGGLLVSDKAASIGTAGMGTLLVESGGTATLAGADVGSGATGIGGLHVDDAGTTVTLTGPLNVGAAVADSAWVLVSSGGVLNLTNPVAGTVWPTSYGDLEVYGTGRVNLGGLLTVRGTLTLTEGDVVGGVVALRGAGRISGDGTVQSALLAGIDTTVTIEIQNLTDDALTIGNTVPGGGVLMRGRINVNTGTVTLVDPDSAVLGSVDLEAGALQLPAGGAVIEAGRQLTGHGTVHGPLRMNGYTVASGAGGLRFAGMLKGTGQGTGGNEIHFLAGGGFEGAGRIAADVYADSGSILRATGNVDLGVASVASLLVLDGRIETGPWRVIFWDGNGTNGVDLSGELVLGGGQVSSGFSYPLNVLSGARVSGSGTFFMPVVSSGTIAPGASAGKMRMVGSLTMSGGELEIEIGRFASGEWDTLSVDGAATLSGTLDVKRLPIFAVHFGDSIEVLHCTSRTGTFASVTLDGAPLAGEFAVHYTPNGVWLVFLQSTVGVGGGPRPVVHDLALAAYGSPGPAPGVELALPAESAITLEAYDVTGRRIVRFHEAALTAGRHRFDLAPHLRAAGLYFVRAAVQTERGMVSRTVRVVRAR